ncbi:hypothetical protein [Faecalicoccus pleomorphus]|uniref:hypothetical protein n=1 Tax=Faecalicoccus pleomorphus TaxID=1323 RepID=UPI001961D158|nr:hypothetical protein [Faecalicoccus pleomorphus]MBM6807524.1 hypothetical protein [Faecalicoccus pleomorphus]
MEKTLTEQAVLKKLGIPDFRHLSKDKVIEFASMLDRMDPQVAIKAIEQFPEFAKTSLEALKDYKSVIEKAFEKNKESSQKCFDMYNEIIKTLQESLDKPDLSFEERKYYIDKMFEIAKMAEKKDSENKQFYNRALNIAGGVALFALGIGVTIIGGKANIKIPDLKK